MLIARLYLCTSSVFIFRFPFAALQTRRSSLEIQVLYFGRRKRLLHKVFPHVLFKCNRQSAALLAADHSSKVGMQLAFYWWFEYALALTNCLYGYLVRSVCLLWCNKGIAFRWSYGFIILYACVPVSISSRNAFGLSLPAKCIKFMGCMLRYKPAAIFCSRLWTSRRRDLSLLLRLNSMTITVGTLR